LNYEFEMMNCDFTPQEFENIHPAKNWEEGRPIRANDYFRLENERTDADGNPLCLEVEQQDAYYPTVTGLYNVIANACGKAKVAHAQEWSYNPVDLTIASVLHPGTVVLEGYNKNIVVYKNLLLDSQRFEYRHRDKHFCNKATAHCMDIQSNPDKLSDGVSVVTALEETDTGFIWKIVYSGGHVGQSAEVMGRDNDYPQNSVGR
jgi:hypothetical protein